MAQTPAPTRWFAMLNTGEPPPEWQRLAQELEALTGADVDVLPHLTAGAGTGEAELEAVASAFRGIDAPRTELRLCPPVEYHQSERLHFHWTMAVAVEADDALRRWHERAQAALRTAGLDAPPARADDWRPHVTVLRGSERVPSLDQDIRRRAIALLAESATTMRLPTVRLHVSRLAAGRFQKVLERALD